MRVAVAGYPLLSRRQWRLYEVLADDTIEPHLLLPDHWPTIATVDHPPESASIVAHYHSIRFQGRKGAYFCSGLGRTLDDVDPDVVLTHAEPWYALAAQMEYFCERKSIPHAIFSWENLHRVPTSKFQRAFERVMNRAVDGVIAGSADAARRLERRGYVGPLVVAPQTGVDVDMFSPGDPDPSLCNSFGIPPDRSLAVYVGRFAPEKGLDTLLAAVPRVIDRTPNAHFLLVGDGEMADSIRARVEDDPLLADHISIVAEFQPYERIPEILRLADVLVYPSRTVGDWAEQFGYAVAEAMACGVPVVTTECGALPTVVGETGVVGPEADARALADNVASLLTDVPRRERLSEAARTRVVERFSLEPVAARHLDLLSTLVNDPP